MIFSDVNNVEKEAAFILENHGKRVGILAFAMANHLGLDEDEQAAMYIAGRWHDLGKNKIPFAILNKKDRLSEDEELLVRMHVIYSFREALERGLPHLILEAIIHHHEDFDGTGYPFGLVGEEIPLASRILRICDTFDALLEERPYRKALTQEEAIEIMTKENEKGKYDKNLFAVFLLSYKEVDSYVEENCDVTSRFIDWSSGDLPVLRVDGGSGS